MRSDNREEQTHVACVRFHVARGIPHLRPLAFRHGSVQPRGECTGAATAWISGWAGQARPPAWCGSSNLPVNDFIEKRYTHWIKERMQVGPEATFFDVWIDEGLHLAPPVFKVWACLPRTLVSDECSRVAKLTQLSL
jgi:hypothetical protein